MKCCKTCKHSKNISGGEYNYLCCLKTSTVKTEHNRVEGTQIIHHYEICTDSVDLCDRLDYYEPNLIQKFKNFLTGE